MSQGLQATWIHGIHARTQAHTNTHAYIHSGAGTHMQQWTSHQRITTRNKVSPDSCSGLRFNATCTHNNYHGLFWIHSNTSNE